MLELVAQETGAEVASRSWESAPPRAGQARLAGIAHTLARCAALYGALHTEEMSRLLHVGGTDVHLLTLLAHTGPLSLTRLAELAPGSPGGTDAAVDRLVDSGFVTRRRGESDRRTVRVQAAPGRAAMVTRPPTATLLALTECLKTLHPARLEQTCDVLSRLDAALTARLRDKGE